MKQTWGARLGLAVLAVGLVVLSIAPAHAAAYRYWSYWVSVDGNWSFSHLGPAFRIPADGTVEGWRFAVDGESGGTPPRAAPDFSTICADTPPADGVKRIAVIVDPGVDDDAPEGQSAPGMWALCVTAPAKATGYDVLRAAASVRVDDGLVCAINAYPADECAIVVSDPTPEPKPSPTPAPEPKPTPKPTPEPKPSPKPTASAEPADPDANPDASPTATAASTTSAPAASPSPSSAATLPSPDDTDVAAASATPTASPEPSSESPSASPPAVPEPTPSMSMLAEPLPESPGDAGSGSAVMTGLAVGGIALLGGAAVIASRRRPG